jgi:hypothetical protein
MVGLFWVSGHCDIRDNKEADGLGSDSRFCGRERTSLTPILNTGSHLTAVDNPSFGLNNQSCKQPNTSLSLPTKQLRILVSLIRGHCFLNKHLHRIGLTTIPVSASCELDEETAFHFVYVCPTLATLRTRIFGKPIMNASEFAEVSASAILTQFSSTCTSTF